MTIDDIKPYEHNAKKHPEDQLLALAKIVKEVGWRQPVLVNQKGIIVVGHGRMLTWQKYGAEYGLKPIWIIDDAGNSVHGSPEGTPLSPEQEMAYRLADNKLNESEWDMELVVNDLKLLPDNMIDLTGFSRDLIITGDPQDDVIPENAPKISSLGDLWRLGKHLLFCGDSKDQESYKKIFFEQKMAKLVFTSPPYNMAAKMYENYKDNLASEEYINFNLQVINNCKKFLRGFIFWNISYNKNNRSEFIEVIYKIAKETELKFLELIVWDKGHAIPITSKEGLTRQYEDIILAGDQESVGSDLELYYCGRNDKKAFFNKKTNKGITNYWRIGTNKTQLENHLACYPVALPLRGIQLMTSVDEIVLDPFLGSGTTMIAAEKSQRRCFGIELDPTYCDIIIKRWEDYTGQKAEKLN